MREKINQNLHIIVKPTKGALDWIENCSNTEEEEEEKCVCACACIYVCVCVFGAGVSSEG